MQRRRAAGAALTLFLAACTHDYAKLRGRNDGSTTMTGPDGGSDAATAGGTGGFGNRGGATAAGGGGGGAGGVRADGGAQDASCPRTAFAFVARPPTVHLLVVRSANMFDCLSTPSAVEPSCANTADTVWVRLKASASRVVLALQADVRFGFTSFTGTNPARGGMCPILTTVPAALNNHATIAGVYDGLPFPPGSTEAGVKFEGPARAALDAVGAQLMADTAASAGERYVLFVTDGELDYCDDGDVVCPPDSVVGALQSLKAKGITTLVMGLPNPTANLPASILQSFANAGAGEPALPPLRPGGDIYSFFDQCSNIAGWRQDAVATGKSFSRGVTVGAYAANPGPTRPYLPDATTPSALETQLARAVAATRGCTFDLVGTSGGTPIELDASKAAGARVFVDGTAVPRDASNGWSSPTATQVQLNGAACATLRQAANARVEFEFPCESLVPR